MVTGHRRAGLDEGDIDCYSPLSFQEFFPMGSPFYFYFRLVLCVFRELGDHHTSLGPSSRHPLFLSWLLSYSRFEALR